MKKIEIYIILLLVLTLFLSSCNSIPDINKTNTRDTDPWLTILSDPATSMTISWLTGEKVITELRFGESPEDLDQILINNETNKLHTIFLEDLQPDTKYYYSIKKEVFSFQTASSDEKDYKITVLGDLQPYKKITRVTNEIMSRSMVKENPDLIAQLGDVSENGGINFLWRNVLKNISRYASKIPFMATAGNHDYYWNGNFNFRKIFPYNYESDTGLYYSLDYSNSHLIFLDVFENNGQVSRKQKEWLENDLQEAKKNGSKWIFIFLHDTILSTGDSSSNWTLQKWIVSLADKNNVDAIFYGHAHNYEHWNYTYGQSNLIHNENDVPSGNSVHYFTSGGGGAALGYNYNVLDKKAVTISTEWYDRTTGEIVQLNLRQKKWNPERFIDHSDEPFFGAPNDGKHYYQLGDEESYSEYNEIYGYEYGEQTLHYININISGESNETCTISVHYPNGELLKGPYNDLPQQWTINKEKKEL